MEKIFAIGDIHGCLGPLRELVSKIGADATRDTLLFIGDYIDRGPAGPAVVDYILGLQKQFSKLICLCGNHEFMLLRYIEGIDEDIYLANGGLITLSAYGIARSDPPRKRRAKIPPEHLRFFESLRPFYETPDYIFVHAGLRPGLSLAEQDSRDMVWIRQEFLESDFDFGKRVIFGHTNVSDPIVEPNKIGIDTGAVYGGRLTCLELPAMKFYSVPS